MDTQPDFFVRGTRGETAEALREHAVHRLAFSLRRFTHLVRHLTVRLVDENGPRGGVDARCSIAAELAGGGRLFVEATTAWPLSAITLAAGRLGDALRRKADRHAGHRERSGGARHALESHRRTS